MSMHLGNDDFSKILQDSEKIGPLSDKAYNDILQSVLKEAGAPDPITYQEAKERLEGMQEKKVYLFPKRIAACAAGFAAVAAAFLLTPTLPEVDPITISDDNLVVIPNEQVPLAALPGASTRSEVQPDGDGGHIMKVYDNNDQEAALLKVASNLEGWPVLETCMLVEGQVGFVISDSMENIRWDTVRGVDQDGNEMIALEVLPQDHLLVFEIPRSSMDLLFQDSDGNWISCTLTMQN